MLEVHVLETRSYHRIDLQEVHTRNIGEVLVEVVAVTGAVRTLASAMHPMPLTPRIGTNALLLPQWMVMTPD
jgi:hypothetical protein